MIKYCLLASMCLVVLSCSQPANKVTYYEQHDNCEMMTILDSAMALNKLHFTGDVDLDIATTLRKHHISTIEMSTYEMEHGKDEEMKKIVTTILDLDKKDMAVIDSFISRHVVTTASGNPEFEIRRAVDKMHHTADLQLIKDDDDRDYAILLLPQRQCNLDLSELIMHYSNAPELKMIARHIQQTESTNIELLQLWLLRNNKNK